MIGPLDPAPPAAAREETQQFPYALLETHPGHLVERQGKVTNSAVLERAGIPTMVSLLKHRRMKWLGHVCPHGRRTHPQGPSLWWAGDREETNRTPVTAVQGHLQARPQSAGHQRRHLGRSNPPQTGPPGNRKCTLRREPDAAGRGEKVTQEDTLPQLTDRRSPSSAEGATESASPASVSLYDAETDERTQRRRTPFVCLFHCLTSS